MTRILPGFAWVLLAAAPAVAGPALDGLAAAVSCGPGWSCAAEADAPVSGGFVRTAAAAPAPALAPGVSFDSVRRAAAAVKLADAREAALFRAGLLNAGRQAQWTPDGTVYVKTGDIPAEWLRDSSAQVAPYLFFAKQDPKVAAFLRGVMLRQARSLTRDPYANAFRADYTVWEEKFELDSLASPILLAWTYWRVTGDATPFGAEMAAGFDAALATMKAEQDHASAPRRYAHRELTRHPVGRTGMIWTGFRPSDDPCTYNFLIPSEMMAVVALRGLAQLESAVYHDAAKAAQASALAAEVDHGIKTFGVGAPRGGKKIYAYEVDGLGHALFMDDANLPSLLSSPSFGYGSASDPLYEETRRFILSPADPYFYSGKNASGVGSPHTPKGMVWPLALIAQAMTATAPAEKARVEREIVASDPGDGRLHESFDPNDPRRLTRQDFGWPNSLFAQYVLVAHGGRAPLPTP